MYIYVEYIYINGAIGQSRLQKNCLNYIEVAGWPHYRLLLDLGNSKKWSLHSSSDVLYSMFFECIYIYVCVS
jgi:hypothetical protein